MQNNHVFQLVYVKIGLKLKYQNTKSSIRSTKYKLIIIIVTIYIGFTSFV